MDSILNQTVFLFHFFIDNQLNYSFDKSLKLYIQPLLEMIWICIILFFSKRNFIFQKECPYNNTLANYSLWLTYADYRQAWNWAVMACGTIWYQHLWNNFQNYKTNTCRYLFNNYFEENNIPTKFKNASHDGAASNIKHGF